jgi:hypothetical protein
MNRHDRLPPHAGPGLPLEVDLLTGGMAPGPQFDEARQIVTEAAAEAGRDPASLGMEGRLR